MRLNYLLLACMSLNYERQNNIKKPFFPHKPGVDSQFVPFKMKEQINHVLPGVSTPKQECKRQNQTMEFMHI